MLENKHWIRLTADCNQGCVWCLDKDAQDGRKITYDDVLAELHVGRKRECTRAILSGGEPTTHPDYVRIVRVARELGYTSIQTVTNGMMFGYPRFLDDCVGAGLTEITFSIHGHTPHLHDGQTRVPGSFNLAVKALKAALKMPVIVSVDIVVTRINVFDLPDIVRFFVELGVREFDLLQLIPFSDGWLRFNTLSYTAEEGRPYIRKTLEYCRQYGVVAWTNRMPIRYMPGFEHFIQPPQKLHSEAEGRRGELAHLIDSGTPLFCYGDRCPHCYLERYCRNLLDVRSEGLEGRLRQVVARAEVTGPDALGRLLHTHEEAAVFLEVSEPSQVPAYLPVLRAGALRFVECLKGLPSASLQEDVRSSDQAPVWRFMTQEQAREACSNGIGAFQLAINKEMDRFLERGGGDHLRGAGERFKGFYFQTFLREDDARLQGVPLDAFVARLAREKIDLPLVNVPPCVGDRPARPFEIAYDAGIPDDRGRIRIHSYTDAFIHRRYFVHGAECDECELRSTCAGFHANYLRAFGWPRRARAIVRRRTAESGALRPAFHAPL